MSLLQVQEKAQTNDASAHGEDYAKGSSYIVLTTVIAAIVVTVGITLFLLADRKPPVAAGEVTQVWVHPVHTLSTPHDAAGVQGPSELFDQDLVFSHLRVRNQSAEPIVVKDLMTNVTLADGIHSSYAATATDYDRIFVAYPELAGLHSTSLSSNTIIQPGQTLDGMIVSAFHVTKEQWAAQKDMSFTVDFKFHPSLVLTAVGQPTEK
jgi:hypothetical protein